MKERRKRKGTITAGAEYLLYRTLAGPVRIAGRSAITRWGDRLGAVLPRLLGRRDAVMRRNLALVFPEKSEAERDEIARACWRFFARMAFRFLHDSGRGRADTRRITIDPPDALHAQIARGKGMVLFTAHYGDWEAALSVLNDCDVPVTVVVRLLDNELLNRDLYRARLQSHVELVDRRTAARPLLRTLEQKGVVVLLADQAVKANEGVLVPFLDRLAWTTPAPAKLSLRTGAPIVCAFSEPTDTEILIGVDAVIDPAELSPEERDVEALTARINAVLAERIRRRPEFWFWLHDRWKGTPR